MKRVIQFLATSKKIAATNPPIKACRIITGRFGTRKKIREKAMVVRERGKIVKKIPFIIEF